MSRDRDVDKFPIIYQKPVAGSVRCSDILTHFLPASLRTSGLTCCRSFSGQHKSHFGFPLDGDPWDWPRCSQPNGRVTLSGQRPDSRLRPKAWFIPAQGNALGSSCHRYSVAGQRPASSLRPNVRHTKTILACRTWIVGGAWPAWRMNLTTGLRHGGPGCQSIRTPAFPEACGWALPSRSGAFGR